MPKDNGTPPMGKPGAGIATHVVKPRAPETPRPMNEIELLKLDLSGDPLKTVTNYYSGSKSEAVRFMSAALDYVRRKPELLECDRLSLILSLVQSAQFRFMPSGVSGEAYIVPYGKEAKFQLGYKGIVTLLFRTNQIASITSHIVYSNDTFEYEEGLEPKLVHKPAKMGLQKGNAIGVYTVVKMINGAKTFKVMDEEEVMQIKALSRAKDSKESPWNGKDPQRWMWRKTCLIQHAKLLPKTDELSQALEKDFEGEGLQRPALDPAGIAVTRASHAVETPTALPPEPPQEKEAPKDELPTVQLGDDLPSPFDEGKA